MLVATSHNDITQYYSWTLTFIKLNINIVQLIDIVNLSQPQGLSKGRCQKSPPCNHKNLHENGDGHKNPFAPSVSGKIFALISQIHLGLLVAI